MTAQFPPYVAEPGGQFVPVTATSSKDCVADVTARGIEAGTVGAKRPHHGQVRKASGAPATRGLWLWEAQKAAATFGVKVETSLHTSRETMKDTVVGGSRVGVTIHTKITRYTTRRTNFYVGPHEVFVHDYNWWPKTGEVCQCEKRTTAPHGEYTVEDPGTTSAGYRQWSADLLYRAAEALTGAYNKINLLVFPDTEQRPWKAVMSGWIRAKPSKTSKALRRIEINRVYPGGRTENGDQWQRADGTMADGWTRVKYAPLRWGWWRGEAGVPA